MTKPVLVNDGEDIVNGWCYSEFHTIGINTEAVYDLLDVYSHMISLNVNKIYDENTKCLKDIEIKLVKPRINEKIVLLAMQNVKEFHAMKEQGLAVSEEPFVKTRRKELKRKWLEVL